MHSSGAKRLLQNLKSYKLACNDVDPHYVAALRKAYGNDEGRVFGALMSGKRIDTTSHDDQVLKARKKKRRRRRNKHQKKSTAIANQQGQELDNSVAECGHTSSLSPLASQSPEPGISCNKLVDYSSDSSNDETTSGKIKLELPAMFLKDEVFDSSTTKCSATPPKPLPHTLDSDSDSDTMVYFNLKDNTSDESNSDSEGCTSAPATTSGTMGTADTVILPGQLSAHICYRCGKVGHLSEDCLARVGQQQDRHRFSQPPEVKSLITRCQKLRNDKNASCITCGAHSNLANCLDCGSNVCDGRGHLVKHLLEHPSHRRLFSYKLSKIVKCCKPSCRVVDCYQLLVCSACFSKIFSQHYSMITATWSAIGLKAISNSLCCDEHFQWHRMNCQSVGDEPLVSVEKLRSSDGTLSDFVF